MSTESRLRKLEAHHATHEADLVVDPELARHCLARARGDVGSMITEWRPMPGQTRIVSRGVDGTHRPVEEPVMYRASTWDGDPASVPVHIRRAAASQCAWRLAKVLGVEAVGRIGWDPAYTRAGGVPPAGAAEYAILRRACRATDPCLSLLARLTAWFLSPEPDDFPLTEEEILRGEETQDQQVQAEVQDQVQAEAEQGR